MRLIKSRVFRNIVAVGTGAAAGQAVTFAFAPLITRLYSPESFGLQGIFLSLVSMLSPLIALRYPMAIVIARDYDEAKCITRLSLIIAAAIVGLLVLVLAFYGSNLLRLLGAQGLGSLIWFLPITLFCVALQDVSDYRAARLGAFRFVGGVTVAQALLTNLARLLGGMIAPVAAVLVIVSAIAPAIQSTMLYIGLREHRISARRFSLREALAILQKHRDFALFRAPTDLMNAFAQTAPVILLSILFSPATAGLYALARSVVNLPLNIIGSAVGVVYYSRLAEMSRDGQVLLPMVLRATFAQFLIPGGGLLVVSFAFPAVFAVMFGETWRPAGEFAQWMALWVVGMLANIPSVRALPVIGAQWIHLVFNVIIMFGGLSGMMTGYWLHGTALAAVSGYSIATAALYALQILSYLQVIARHDRIH